MRHSYRETLRKVQEGKIVAEQKIVGWAEKLVVTLTRAIDLCPDPSINQGLIFLKAKVVRYVRAPGQQLDLSSRLAPASQEIVDGLALMEKILSHRADKADRARVKREAVTPERVQSEQKIQRPTSWLERSQPPERGED